jgi:hypothetical protein
VLAFGVEARRDTEVSVVSGVSRYARLRAAGRCGHCGRRPFGGRAVCDSCLARVEQRRRTGSSAGWRRLLWTRCIERLRRARPLPLTSDAPIRTDDPRFMSPEWFLSLTFDLAKIDRMRPPYWLLQQIYWQERKRVLKGWWLMSAGILSSEQAQLQQRLRRVSLAYERRLAELGIASCADGDEETVLVRVDPAAARRAA